MGQGAATSPEALLERAQSAPDASRRAKYATRGLSQPTLALDTQVLLLRQLYLAHLERDRFQEARDVAEQMVTLGELREPAHHDAARACIAQGDFMAAARHLRSAARHGPAQRRALHCWSLGRVLLHAGAIDPAVAALGRAVRWSTEHQSVYRAHVALARHLRGESVDLRAAYRELSRLDPLPLYAEYLGAELLAVLGQQELASELHSRFLAQWESAALETRVALTPEAAIARRSMRSRPRGPSL